MTATLPALLVTATFGIAAARARCAFWVLVAFAATAVSISCVSMPIARSEPAHFSSWIAVVACGASVHLAAPGPRVAFALAIAAGAGAGLITHDATTLAMLPLVAAVALLASRVIARYVPLATKVVCSWLIAVALLAATLQTLPVTPGYLPDHLD